MSTESASQQTLMDHIHELRSRLFSSVLVILAGAVIGYIFRAEIIQFLQRPLGEQLFYTSPMASFEVLIKTCLLVGFVLALPVFVYNVLRFLEPAFKTRLSRRLITTILIASFLLMVGGLAFGYFVSLPMALHFFSEVATDSLQPMISVDQYFGFLFTYLGTFAVIFQLPLIMLLINHIRPMGPGGLKSWRKFVIVGAFAIGVITPTPDPMSQLTLAAPIILLFELTNVAIRIKNRRLHKVGKQIVSVAPTTTKAALPQIAKNAVPKPQPLAIKPKPVTPLIKPVMQPIVKPIVLRPKPVRSSIDGMLVAKPTAIRPPVRPVKLRVPTRPVQNQSMRRGFISDVLEFKPQS